MMRLIDADALKEYITKAYEEMKSEFKTDKYRDMAKLITESFCMDIDEAPTVDAEPVRHGHWIPFGSMHRCSICEETVLVPTTIAGIPTYDYCPHCGAKMEVEK